MLIDTRSVGLGEVQIPQSVYEDCLINCEGDDVACQNACAKLLPAASPTSTGIPGYNVPLVVTTPGSGGQPVVLQGPGGVQAIAKCQWYEDPRAGKCAFPGTNFLLVIGGAVFVAILMRGR